MKRFICIWLTSNALKAHDFFMGFWFERYPSIGSTLANGFDSSLDSNWLFMENMEINWLFRMELNISLAFVRLSVSSRGPTVTESAKTYLFVKRWAVNACNKIHLIFVCGTYKSNFSHFSYFHSSNIFEQLCVCAIHFHEHVFASTNRLITWNKNKVPCHGCARISVLPTVCSFFSPIVFTYTTLDVLSQFHHNRCTKKHWASIYVINLTQSQPFKLTRLCFHYYYYFRYLLVDNFQLKRKARI